MSRNRNPRLRRRERRRARRERLQGRQTADASLPMRIGIIYTGGTIGCVGEPLSPLDQAGFQQAFTSYVTPIIQEQYPGCAISFLPFGATLDSTNLQPHDWCKMADFVLGAYEEHDLFLILHGTDTMAWSASALSFLLTGLTSTGFPNAVLSKPVVITGSQLPLFVGASTNPDDVTGLLFNTDALQNVCGAIEAGSYGPPEVCLYFDYQLFRGNRTVKTDASEFHAFSSPNYRPLGESGLEFSLDNDQVLHLPTVPSISLEDAGARAVLKAQLDHISANIDSTIVIPFLAFPAPYSSTAQPNTSVIADMLNAMIAQGLNGLSLQSYGAGNYPSGNPGTPSDGAIYQALKAAHDSGVILLDTTQVLSGIVNSTVYAAGSWLAEVGAIGVYDMTPIAATAKLIYLYTLRSYNGNNWSQADIERLMQINITGEMMDVDRLDTRGELFLAPAESITTLDGTHELINSPSEGPLFQTVPTQPGEQPVVKWRAVDSAPSTMPGRLYMQSNGDLVFYDSANASLYASGTAQQTEATSMLIADGSRQAGGPRLYIYNYARGEITATLYSEAE